MTTLEVNETEWYDEALPEDKAIKAAHPTRTGRHDLYAEAMRLVGAKRSKHALVELVNWLLHEKEKAMELIDKSTFEGKTIAEIDSSAVNCTKFYFTDGTDVTLEVDLINGSIGLYGIVQVKAK